MVVNRHRFILLLVALTLFLTPFAQAQDAACPPPFSDDGETPASLIQPLLAEERLLYAIDRLPGGTLEVHYLVNGALHLSEVLDLDSLSLPLTRESQAPKGLIRQRTETPGGAPVPRKREGAELTRTVELLTLVPDSVRELHRLAREGAVIEVTLRQGGSIVETLSYAELTARSAALAEKGFTPVFAPVEVSGPGLDRPVRTGRVQTNEYLENCGDCTYDHPCDTECGWDPGKGGPVTCGEQGQPCGGQPTCAGSTVMGEWWGPWTYHSTSYSGWSVCLKNSFSGGYRYYEKLTTYRRDRIRRTRTCPNAPSCDGCYDTDSVVSVGYSYSVCYENSYSFCSFPETACCSSLSCSGFISPCTNTFPCW
jgi:hypothetical protein